jgi:hypothetical protein
MSSMNLMVGCETVNRELLDHVKLISVISAFEINTWLFRK